MGSKRNKHNLTRHIPEKVKAQVRTNSKFACVVPNCRNAFYVYEHLIPEFTDAIEHDPDKICLVCPAHNPRITGAGGEELYSKKQLIAFYSKVRSTKEPLEIYSKDLFNGFQQPVTISLGGFECENINSIININDVDVFSFRVNPDNSDFAPEILFNGRFEKPNGKLLFEVRDNEWISNSDHGDVTFTNGVLTIMDEGNIIFRMRKLPSENKLVIDDLDLWVSPFHISVVSGELVVARHDLDAGSFIAAKIRAHVTHQDSAIKLTTKNLAFPIKFQTDLISYSGNNGFLMKSNGIRLASGPGISLVKLVHIICKKNNQTTAYKFIDTEGFA